MNVDSKIVLMLAILVAGFVLCVDSCNKSPSSALSCSNACRDKMDTFDPKTGVCKCK